MTSSKRPAAGAGAVPPAGPSKPSSSYTRFIPREELHHFDSWKLAPLSGEPGPGAAPPMPTSAAQVAASEAQAAQQLRAQLSAARQTGYQDGYRDGLVALEGFKQGYSAQVTAQLGGLVRSMQSQLDALEDDMAKAVCRASLQLAQRVLRAELTTHPEHVATLAREAMAAVLLHAHHIVVHVHPDDHALVAQGAAEALATRNARLQTDAAIERGGCLITSDLGTVDARISHRWDEAAQSLGHPLPWVPAA